MNEIFDVNYSSQIQILNARVNPFLNGRVVVSEMQQFHYPQEINDYENE